MSISFFVNVGRSKKPRKTHVFCNFLATHKWQPPAPQDFEKPKNEHPYMTFTNFLSNILIFANVKIMFANVGRSQKPCKIHMFCNFLAPYKWHYDTHWPP